MFKHTQIYSGFSVDDIEQAKKFYGQTLGLEVKDADMGTLSLSISADTHVLIYPKPNHEPATFTILNFAVPNVEEAVDALTDKGIIFERYEGMNHDEKGISHNGGPLIAWFKDPAGNVLSVIEEDKHN